MTILLGILSRIPLAWPLALNGHSAHIILCVKHSVTNATTAADPEETHDRIWANQTGIDSTAKKIPLVASYEEVTPD